MYILNKIDLRSQLQLFVYPRLNRVFDFSQGYKEIPRVQRYSKKSWPRASVHRIFDFPFNREIDEMISVRNTNHVNSETHKLVW